MPYTELYQLIIEAITLVAVLIAVYQIILTRRQLYLTTITNCVREYRSIPHFDKFTTDTRILYRYIDLTNEELFYIKNDYIPKAVAVDCWMV